MFAYIASPYTDRDPDVRHRRYEEAELAMAQMMMRGDKVYGPIAMTHHAAVKYGMPTSSSWWRPHNYAFLGMASELRVLMIDGWDKSEGVGDEIDMALKLDIPVSYWHRVCDEWRKAR